MRAMFSCDTALLRHGGGGVGMGKVMFCGDDKESNSNWWLGDVLVSLVPYGSFKIWTYPLVHKKVTVFILVLSVVFQIWFVSFCEVSWVFLFVFWTCLKTDSGNEFRNIYGYCVYCFTVTLWELESVLMKKIYTHRYVYIHARAHSHTHTEGKMQCTLLKWILLGVICLLKKKKNHSSSTVVKIPHQLLIMKLFPLYLHEVDIPRG